MPYGPPGAPACNPYNPYQAPLPKRGGIKRLIWVLCTLGVLVLGGCGVGIYFLAKTVTRNADATNTFLRHVRDQQFSAAYNDLCPAARTAEPQFVSRLQTAAAGARRLVSFDITSSNTSVSNGVSSREASGTVTFSGGLSTFVTFELGKSNGQLCIESGYATLF